MKRLTVKEVSDVMNIPVQTVRVLIQQGKLPAVVMENKKRNTYFIYADQLAAYLKVGVSDIMDVQNTSSLRNLVVKE